MTRLSAIDAFFVAYQERAGIAMTLAATTRVEGRLDVSLLQAALCTVSKGVEWASGDDEQACHTTQIQCEKDRSECPPCGRPYNMGGGAVTVWPHAQGGAHCECMGPADGCGEPVDGTGVRMCV